MNIKEVRAGTSAEVFSYSRSGDRISFKTKVEEISGKLNVKVLADNISPRLTGADEFELFIREGSEDYMWEADNYGMKRSGEGFTLLELKLHNPVAKISSRRAHFRLTHIVIGELLYLEKNTSAMSQVDLVDVSAGGVAFLSDVALHIGDSAKLRFPIEDDVLMLNFQIVSKDLMPADFKVPYRYRCKWVNLTATIEESIVRHIFKMQQAKR